MNESVSLPLAKLIFDYIKNRRDIDKSFIDKVVEIVVNNLSLNAYVKDIIISNKHWDGSEEIQGASFNWRTRILTIELQAELEFISDDLKNLGLNSNDKFALIYDRIMQIILHELEHANQLKKINVKENNLETKIITFSSLESLLICRDGWFDKLVDKGYSEGILYLYLTERQKRYIEFWKYAPIERLAEYYSHKTMAAIFKEIGNIPNISYYECLKLCQNYLKGYDEGLVPTKYYLAKICASHPYRELEEEGKNLDFESRASLGLSISADEYAYLLDTTEQLRELVIR